MSVPFSPPKTLMTDWTTTPDSALAVCLPPMALPSRLAVAPSPDSDILAFLPVFAQGMAECFKNNPTLYPGDGARRLQDAMARKDVKAVRSLTASKEGQIFLLGVQRHSMAAAHEAARPMWLVGPRESEDGSFFFDAAQARAALQAWRAMRFSAPGRAAYGTIISELFVQDIQGALLDSMRHEAHERGVASQESAFASMGNGGGPVDFMEGAPSRRVMVTELAPLARAQEEPWRSMWSTMALCEAIQAEMEGQGNSWRSFPYHDLENIAGMNPAVSPEQMVRHAMEAALAAGEAEQLRRVIAQAGAGNPTERAPAESGVRLERESSVATSRRSRRI